MALLRQNIQTVLQIALERDIWHNVVEAGHSMTPSMSNPLDFTYGQQVALVVTITISSLLSVVGSSIMLFIFWKNRKHSIRKIKYRLMIMLCFYDVLSSAFYMLWSVALPSETEFVGAHGNQMTCSAFGFIVQVGTSGSFYMAAISGYFLHSLRYGQSDHEIATKYEFWTHVVSISFPLIGGVIGLALDLFQVSGFGCFISTYPYGCKHDDDVECETGERAFMWIWLLDGGPLMILMMYHLYAMYLTYRTVKVTGQRAEQITFETSELQFHTSISFAEIEAKNTATSSAQEQQRKASMATKYSERTKQVAIQSALYVAAYLGTHSFAFLVSILEQFGVPNHFVVTYLNTTTWPLQGIFNLAIFLRPQVAKILKNDSNLSYWRVYFQAIVEFKMEDSSMTTRSSSVSNESGNSPKIRFQRERH